MPFGEHMGAFLRGIHLGVELGHAGTALMLRFNRFSLTVFQSHWTHMNSHLQHKGFLDLCDAL